MSNQRTRPKTSRKINPICKPTDSALDMIENTRPISGIGDSLPSNANLRKRRRSSSPEFSFSVCWWPCTLICGLVAFYDTSVRMRSNSIQPGTTRPSNRQYLGWEMILRRSLSDSLKEYLRNCSLAGARQLCDPRLGWLERFIWGVVFLTALGAIVYFLQYIWRDILSKPLIVTLESATYPIGSIDFPAVAICSINKISKKALKKLAMEEYKDLATTGESIEEVEAALLNWGRLINFSFNDSLRTYPLFRRMVEKYRFDNQKIKTIMEMLAPKCDEMFLRCAWEGVLVDCSSLFVMHRIANRGHCCAFNYWARLLIPDSVKRQSEPGNLFGLNLILDPLLDDYAYPMAAVLGFEILILDPAHVADPNSGRVIQRLAEPNKALYLELKSTKQVATAEVRKYAVTTRKCLFKDEITGPFDLYSYSTCLVYCKISTMFSLCKCTPFFFANEKMQQGPVCGLEDLKCLNKYREKFYYLYPHDAEDTQGLEYEMQDSLSCPHCLPDCELIQYYTKSFEIPVRSPYKEKDIWNTLIGETDVTNKTLLSIYHPLPDSNLDKLDVVFYWYEILSNIGGFCGIVVGFSIMSAVELLYFLSIRLVANIHINYHKYHAK